MVVCFATGCESNSKTPNCRFFRFPADAVRRQLWLNILCQNVNIHLNESARLCELQLSKLREANMEMQISKFLNNDQIEKLKQSNDAKGKGITWSNNTIQRCIAIRSIVGRNGYEYLRTLKFPLPSYRTLCRRIQNSSFEPGIQYDVLQWLKIKMDKKPEYEKLCVLLVDEMQLKSRVELDKGLKRMVGYVSLHYQYTADGQV